MQLRAAIEIVWLNISFETSVLLKLVESMSRRAAALRRAKVRPTRKMYPIVFVTSVYFRGQTFSEVCCDPEVSEYTDLGVAKTPPVLSGVRWGDGR